MRFSSVAKTLGIAAAAIGMVAVSQGSALAKYPERPIQIIIPWGAGGGTDATGRMIGTVLQKELGVPVNVVNRTGGQGVVGHSAIATAKPDGYTLGVATVEIVMMHWTGLTKLTYKGLHPDRPVQRRSGRRPGRGRRAVEGRHVTARRHQGQSRQVQGIGHVAGRHLASGAGRYAADRRHRRRGGPVGSQQGRRARVSRNWSLVAFPSSPARRPRPARWPTPVR